VCARKGGRVNRVKGVLIHKYVFFESIFGSSGGFIDMMFKIVRALMV